MTPPDKSSTESRMHTLLADFQKGLRPPTEPESLRSPQCHLRRYLARYLRTMSVLRPAEIDLKIDHAKESLRKKFKPDERQSRRNGGNFPQSMKNKDHIEVLGTEAKSLKRELETMRSCRSDARSSEQDR
ncbi:uncharacterized protein N7506_005402 [Penicillium brevicompactum]|uniref:uncharacterized protein n=1 Tax=Penicillium brevicompactum TaxID=5074 RepID=UPI002541D56C|nr:uncharacterized protein N7506_005402 [Penicillium brevicompactum]KAJ5337380.1 hypothetical protein N7506_005402 [Penicillium brevicompactum]